MRPASGNGQVASRDGLTRPAELYAELFDAVQTSGVLGDSKIFVDARPKMEPREILGRFRRQADAESFDLLAFVNEHFELPAATDDTPPTSNRPVRDRIERLWDSLARDSDTSAEHSTLIGLPHPYVVPGGRFREIYYWDSYFTMLGLAAAGRHRQVADMVANFAYLIDTVGFVPNGNRSYFCSRSQPPYFSMMVELLAGIDGSDEPYRRYLGQLEREYAFWMDGAGGGKPVRRVIPVDGGWLNRYWDDEAEPRPESYAEDRALAASCDRDERALYRDLRAACESGWDFSSRWLAEPDDLGSIRTTHVVPVDLNALLWKLESVLAHARRVAGDRERSQHFAELAARRHDLIERLFFREDRNLYTDLLLPDLSPSGAETLATAYPLYLSLSSGERASRVAAEIGDRFLADGGWLTSGLESGQQWDAPNGWAPLEWICYRGLRNYGLDAAAADGANRWLRNNLAVYRESGRLMEKYDVVNVGRRAGGGEYGVQEGFGWTNGVLLCLLNELGIDPA